MADRMAESGETTPGCDCGHDGMGISWHRNDCAWRLAGSKRAAKKPCNCDRFDCDACLTAYLKRVSDAASGVTGQVLGNLQGFASAFAAGLRESLLPKLPQDGEKAAKPSHWCCNGNAEECPLCDVGELPYPWICPGNHENSPITRRTVLTTAADLGKEKLHAAMARLRAWDAAVDAENGVEEPEEPPEVNEALREAAERLPRTVRRPRRVPVQRTAGERREEHSRPADASPGLDPEAFRALVSAEVLHVAIERTTREWICCNPVNPDHELCVKGEATVNMLTALLTDDDAVFPSRSDVLDVIMGLVIGASVPGARGTVLSASELRELYFKAIHRGFQRTVDWNGMDDLKPLRNEMLHHVTAEVLTVRDRELQRLRQRLLLADHEHRVKILAEMSPAEDAAVMEKRVRMEERLKTLTELRDKLRSECTSSMEEVAFHNVFVWVNRELKSVKRMLDKPSQD